MQVLNINKFYYLRGGTERYVFALTKLLKDHGHEVIPFAMKDNRNLPSPWSKYFVSHLELGQPTLGMAAQFERSIWSGESKAQLNRLLNVVTPDIAHVHLIYHHISPSIFPVLKKAGIPIVMTLHDYKVVSPNYVLYCHEQALQPTFYNNYIGTIAKRCMKDSLPVSAAAVIEFAFHRLFKIYERYVDVFIAPSQAVKDICVRGGLNEKKIAVIPHFLDQDFLAMADKARTARSKQPFFLYFGRLSEEKGVDKILEMLHIYKVKVPVLIAGSGPLQSKLEAYSKAKGLDKQVKFLGHLEKKELMKLIQQAWAVIMPSQFDEPFGFAALETMALGTPIVASDRGALPNIIPSNLGEIFPADDRQAMALALKEVITWDRAKLKRDAKKLIEKHYMPERHYAALMTVYHHLMRRED